MDEKMYGNETIMLELSDNGHLVLADFQSINRGFLFGDGLFETMIFTAGTIRFKEAHISRMRDGCRVLKLEMDDSKILDMCESYIIASMQSGMDVRIRWNVYRKGLGRYTPETNHTDHLFMLQVYQHSGPILKKAYISQTIRVPSLLWSNCKTLNAMVYVMANLERQKKNYDEVILLNADGYICEAGAANLFWIKDSVYYTPSLRSSCIAGIGRKAIIDKIKDSDLELIQGEFKSKEFLSADQVFTSNVTGINYISQIDMREFDTTPLPLLEKLFI